MAVSKKKIDWPIALAIVAATAIVGAGKWAIEYGMSKMNK